MIPQFCCKSVARELILDKGAALNFSGVSVGLYPAWRLVSEDESIWAGLRRSSLIPEDETSSAGTLR